jgi:hypothetical protein
MTQAAPVIFKIPAKSATGPRQGRPPCRAGEDRAASCACRVAAHGSRPRATSVEVSFYGGVAHKD